MTMKTPDSTTADNKAHIIERPDGFYWQHEETGAEFGPFATLAAATEDMEFADAGFDDGETLAEAESEIGMADWIDPDTGQPAEDGVPHIDDR